MAVRQAAAVAKARGSMPGDLGRLAQEAVRSRVDWRSVLIRFAQQAARDDYSWSRPNPRYFAAGLYLPSLRSEAMGPLVVAIDTSGSIDNVLLGQFEAEVRAIAEDLRPARVHVLSCDAEVRRHDVFEKDDPITVVPGVGGGGTDFRPVFEAVDGLEDAPAAIVYLTDLAGTFPEKEPQVPVLWATTSQRQAPFGETVAVE